MVKNVDKFKARLRAAPEVVRKDLKVAIEKAAESVVQDMRIFNPLPNDIEIGWTWGDAPDGAITVSSFKGTEFDWIKVTIYAKGDNFPAAWFEHGTANRFHKSGKSTGRIVASPFFYPVFRANKSRIKSRISRALRAAIKKV